MDLMKVISFVIGCLSSSFFMLLVYFFTTHSSIKQLNKDVNDIYKYVHEIHKTQNIDNYLHKKK